MIGVDRLCSAFFLTHWSFQHDSQKIRSLRCRGVWALSPLAGGLSEMSNDQNAGGKQMLENSVTRLRQKQKALSRREFLARGSKLSRCEDCLLASRLCVCAARPEPMKGVALCLIYYQGEVFKPSNTGRLIADVLEDNHAYQWTRTDPDAGMLALLSDPGYAPLVVFPYEYAQPERHMSDDQRLRDYIGKRTPLLIFLDGTWREARKMFRSDWLNRFPVIAVEPQALSEYRLRVAARDHQLGTAEVAIALLSRLGQDRAASNLASYFSVFRENYLAGRTNTFLTAVGRDSRGAPEN